MTLNLANGFRFLVVLSTGLLLCGSGDARADVIYSDGNNHSVTTTVNDRFIVNSNSTMTLGIGGAALPPGPQGLESVSLTSGTLNLAGGTIGGSFYGVNGTSNATFIATSGTVNGGNNGGTAVWLEAGSGNISGGTFNGGGAGGTALLLDSSSVPMYLNTSIKGGNFNGGANAGGQGGAAVFLTAFGTNVLAISGGSFTGGTGSSLANSGAALSLLSSTIPSQNHAVTVTVSGGLFNGAIDLRSMDQASSVAFDGGGITFTDYGNGTGLLSGTLLDGSTINSIVLDTGDSVVQSSSQVIFNGSFNGAAVPEPSPLLLGALTAFIVVGFSRMRHWANG